MNLIEFLGFIAMLFFLMHSARNKRRKENLDEEDTEELEQAERLRAYLQGVDSDMNDIAAPTSRAQPISIPKPQKVQKESPKWEHQTAKPQQKSIKDKQQHQHKLRLNSSYTPFEGELPPGS